MAIAVVTAASVAATTTAGADQMTFPHRVRLLSRGAALAALVLAGAACSSDGGSTTTTAATSIPPVADSTATTAAAVSTAPATTVDAPAALQAALAGLAGGYHFTAVATVNGTPTLQADGDRIGDSSQLSLTNNGATVEYVITPQGSYAKPTDGDWQQLDVPPATADPIDALKLPVAVVQQPTTDGTVVLRTTVPATALGLSSADNVDVDVTLSAGAITRIAYSAPVEGGTAMMVTDISALADSTPITAPM